MAKVRQGRQITVKQSGEPVVLKQRVRFSAFAYVPLALLHVSLLVRLADASLRPLGGVLNAAAIVLFAAGVIASVERRGTMPELRAS